MENLFKDFLYCQRKIDLSERYLHVHVNIAVRLYQYMKAFGDIQFLDGNYYKYCGELKLVVNNFIMFWTEIMNEILAEADYLKTIIDSSKLIEMVDVTLEVQSFKQKCFSKGFLPAANDIEQKAFNEVRQIYRARVRDLIKMKAEVLKLDKKEDVISYADREFERSVRIRNEVFKMAHTKIAVRLANMTNKINTSYVEILNHTRNNLSKLRNEQHDALNKLLSRLYDANKEKLLVSRQEKHRTTDTVEVEKGIKKIRDKIELMSFNRPIKRVEEELRYWEKRYSDFKEIDETIRKIGKELKNVTESLKEYESLISTEHPGTKKRACWDTIGENLRQRKAFLDDAYVEAAKAMMTFFAVRGRNRILYRDNKGQYAIDDFGHQIYVSNYGANCSHVQCDGTHVQYTDIYRYYFDENGRYVLDDGGGKIYKRAYCASLYKLNEHLLLEKTTKDCGHSMVPNPECKMQSKDPNDIELLPMVDPVDIRASLTPEVTSYLWNSLGSVLPSALCSTGQKRSNNPINYLAHELVKIKYFKNTNAGLRNLKKEAILYRDNIYKDGKQKDIQLAKQWKGKLVKPRKPEESDDMDKRVLLEERDRQLQIANRITYDNNY